MNALVAGIHALQVGMVENNLKVMEKLLRKPITVLCKSQSILRPFHD